MTVFKNNILIFLGNLHNRIYVIWIVKTVSEEDKKKCEETTTPSMETMVFTNTVCAEVSQHDFICCEMTDYLSLCIGFQYIFSHPCCLINCSIKM